jgi:hypothetical protein
MKQRKLEEAEAAAAAATAKAKAREADRLLVEQAAAALAEQHAELSTNDPAAAGQAGGLDPNMSEDLLNWTDNENVVMTDEVTLPAAVLLDCVHSFRHTYQSEIGLEEPTAQYCAEHSKEYPLRILTDFLTIEFLATNKILFASYIILKDIGLSNRNTWAGELLHPCEYYRSWAGEFLHPCERYRSRARESLYPCKYYHSNAYTSPQLKLYQGEFNCTYNSDLG